MPSVIERFHVHTNVNVFKMSTMFEKEISYTLHDINVRIIQKSIPLVQFFLKKIENVD